MPFRNQLITAAGKLIAAAIQSRNWNPSGPGGKPVGWSLSAGGAVTADTITVNTVNADSINLGLPSPTTSLADLITWWRYQQFTADFSRALIENNNATTNPNNIPNNTETVISFEVVAESFNDPLTGNTMLVSDGGGSYNGLMAQRTGAYQCSASISFTAASSGQYELRLYHKRWNGTAFATVRIYRVMTAFQATTSSINLSVPLYLRGALEYGQTLGDIVEVRVLQTSGATKAMTASAAFPLNWLALTKF